MDEQKGKWNSKQKGEIPKTLPEYPWMHLTGTLFLIIIHFVVVIGCKLPISGAEAERSFFLIR